MSSCEIILGVLAIAGARLRSTPKTLAQTWAGGWKKIRGFNPPPQQLKQWAIWPSKCENINTPVNKKHEIRYYKAANHMDTITRRQTVVNNKLD